MREIRALPSGPNGDAWGCDLEAVHVRHRDVLHDAVRPQGFGCLERGEIEGDFALTILANRNELAVRNRSLSLICEILVQP